MKSLTTRIFTIWLYAGALLCPFLAIAETENPDNHSQITTLNTLNLTALELQWIKDHPVVLYSDDVSWQPFVHLNKNKQLEGMSPEFLKHIQKLTGINFKFVPVNSWKKVISLIKNKQITLVLATIATPERKEFVDFSEPYFSSKLAIVTGPDYSYIQQLDELHGKTVVVPASYSTVNYLRANHPQINLKLVSSIDQAFNAVLGGEADAFLGTLAITIYRLQKSRYTTLKISGTIDQNTEVRFMIAKGNNELVSIINKALAKISPKNKQMIINNWFGVKVEQGINPFIIWKILFTASIILFFTMMWITKLRKEIRLRKDAERNLTVAREEADFANNAKSEFLANMSHEIRTPMNAIVAFSDLLAETPLNVEQNQYLASIKVGSSGLLRIINDILDISKIEAGKIAIQNEPVNITNLCNELEQLFIAPMQEKHLTFSIDIQPTCPQTVMSDKYRLMQILINLIGNAHKFTSKGFVKLKIYSVPTNTLSTVDLKIEVSDTGVGIVQQEQTIIFDHFIQNKKSMANSLGGTGLGLSISKKLAEKMNGSLTLTSEFNIGSCFTLTLHNMEVTTLHAPVITEVKDIQFSKACVLVVDDIKTNRIILQKYLSKYPFKIIFAENGQQAINTALAEKPDLILMDLRMPIMDGYEAAHIIKETLDTYIVAVTASALDDEASVNKRKIFDAFLRKPIRHNDLLNSLDELLNSN